MIPDFCFLPSSYKYSFELLSVYRIGEKACLLLKITILDPKYHFIIIDFFYFYLMICICQIELNKLFDLVQSIKQFIN